MEKVSKKLKLRAFGITKEILGGREVMVDFEGQTVADLRNQLLEKYTALVGLRSLMIAVNNVYADESQIITESDEVALIPPVSGG